MNLLFAFPTLYWKGPLFLFFFFFLILHFFFAKCADDRTWFDCCVSPSITARSPHSLLMLYETQSQNRLVIEGVILKVTQAVCNRTWKWSRTTLYFHCKAFLLLQPFLAKMPNTLVLWARFHAQHISGVQRRVGKSRFVSAWEGFDSCRVKLGSI